MPTRYTAAIKDGISFEQFVMQCARAMGALIQMRDEHMDAPIPERFEPSTYHADALAQAEQNLALFANMSESEAESEAKKDYREQCERNGAQIQEATDLLNKYNAMLANVVTWQAPTLEHEHFKKFMIDQIRRSIDFDCDTKYYTAPALMTAAEWKEEKVRQAKKDIEYHAKGNQEEIERTEQRNAWINQLRDSLKQAA